MSFGFVAVGCGWQNRCSCGVWQEWIELSVLIDVEHGAHDMCADSSAPRKQCDLFSHPERKALLWFSGQHNQSKAAMVTVLLIINWLFM